MRACLLIDSEKILTMTSKRPKRKFLNLFSQLSLEKSKFSKTFMSENKHWKVLSIVVQCKFTLSKVMIIFWNKKIQYEIKYLLVCKIRD